MSESLTSFAQQLNGLENSKRVNAVVESFLKSKFDQTSIETVLGDFNDQRYTASKSVVRISSNNETAAQDFRFTTIGEKKHGVTMGSPMPSNQKRYCLDNIGDCEMFLKRLEGRLKSKIAGTIAANAPK